MSEPPIDPAGSTGPAPRFSGHASGMAWLVIVVTAAVVIWIGALDGQDGPEESAESGVSLPVELTGKMFVGLEPVFPGYESLFIGQIEQTAQTDVDRLCAAVLAGELSGPAEAVERLAEEPDSPDPGLQTLRNALRDLYGDLAEGRGALPSLSDDERALIEDRLGWFGQLALHAPGVEDEAGRERLLASLWRVPVVLIGVMCWFGFCAIAGIAVLIAMLVMAISGRLRHGFTGTGRGAIYAETFALWFLWFFGFQLLVKQLAERGIVPSSVAMPAGLAIFWLSLLALAWPVKRGIPWRQVRQDIGLTWGRGPVVESLAGGLAYVTSVPLLLIGAIFFVALSVVVERFAPGGAPPSHPVQETISGGSWAVIATVFFLACVAAPVVEETMFRGVLYRHLREATGRMALWLSIAISAVSSSFLFAVIHPQGWVFAPVLTGLAVAFCLAREWRGSLVSCMVAHGITNALALTLNLALFRGV